MTAPPLITGPVPAESNPPIQPQFYAPRRFVITDITLGSTTTITTSLPQDFVVSQQVRILIPVTYGTRQLNNQTAYVIDIPSDTEVVINIDSTLYDPFISSSETTKPQIIPIGDISFGGINTSRNQNFTLIPGSFINISPA